MYARISLLFFLLALLPACAGMNLAPVAPKYVNTDFPSLNKTVTVEVGNTMVEQSHVTIYDAIVVDQPWSPSSALADFGSVASGAVFRKTQVDDVGHYWYSGELTNQGHSRAVTLPRKFFDDMKFVYHDSSIEYATSDSFRIQLLYNGKSGNNIHLSYHEFSQSMVRPAFSQELVFDISKDKVVGFRGARFEISNATNTGITFRMISPLTK